MAKKKPSKPDPKVIQAQNRNRYLKQMKVVYDKVHPDLFSSLTREHREILYSLRGTSVHTCSEQNISGGLLRYCDDYIKLHMNHHRIEIIPGELTLSLLEYSTYFFPLELGGEYIDDHFEGSDWYKQHIMDGRQWRKDNYDALMCAISVSFMRYVSNQQYTMFHLKYKISEEWRANGNPFVDQKFILLASCPRELVKTFLDEKKKPRTAIELLNGNHIAFEDEDYEPLTPFMMLPSKLGVKVEGEEMPLPVIILRHALRRLDERLECLMTGFSEAQIIPSLLKGNVCYTPNGKMLVEYYINKKKAGYLQVDVDDEAILIRTFLFLTNTSTPEGQKLRTHIGLRKEDMKFLNIDRLTPLMESDLLQDEELCKLFRDAGCESLIELCEELKSCEFWKHPEEKRQLAEKLKRYMQLDSEEV